MDRSKQGVKITYSEKLHKAAAPECVWMYVGGKQDTWLPGYRNMLIWYSDVAPWQWMCSDTLNSTVWLPGELKIRLLPLQTPTDWLLGCSNVSPNPSDDSDISGSLPWLLWREKIPDEPLQFEEWMTQTTLLVFRFGLTCGQVCQFRIHWAQCYLQFGSGPLFPCCPDTKGKIIYSGSNQ